MLAARRARMLEHLAQLVEHAVHVAKRRVPVAGEVEGAPAQGLEALALLPAFFLARSALVGLAGGETRGGARVALDEGRHLGGAACRLPFAGEGAPRSSGRREVGRFREGFRLDAELVELRSLLRQLVELGEPPLRGDELLLEVALERLRLARGERGQGGPRGARALDRRGNRRALGRGERRRDRVPRGHRRRSLRRLPLVLDPRPLVGGALPVVREGGGSGGGRDGRRLLGCEPCPCPPRRRPYLGPGGERLEIGALLDALHRGHRHRLRVALEGEGEERRPVVDASEGGEADGGVLGFAHHPREDAGILDSRRRELAHLRQGRALGDLREMARVAEPGGRRLARRRLVGVDGCGHEPELCLLAHALVRVPRRDQGEHRGVLDLLDRRPPHARVLVAPGEGEDRLVLARGQAQDRVGAHGGVGALPVGLGAELVEQALQSVSRNPPTILFPAGGRFGRMNDGLVRS